MRSLFAPVFMIALFVVGLLGEGCGLFGVDVPCDSTANCPAGTCVANICVVGGEGEGGGEGGGEGEGEGEGQPETSPLTCSDGIDNDNSGGFDCEDTSCAAFRHCKALPVKAGAVSRGAACGLVTVPLVADLVVSANVTAGGICFTDIITAVAAADIGETIWVETGTYNVDMNRRGPLVLKQGVTLLGEPGDRAAMPRIRVSGPQETIFLSLRDDADIRGVIFEAITGIDRIVSLESVAAGETTIAFCEFSGQAVFAIDKSTTSAAIVSVFGSRFENGAVTIVSDSSNVAESRFIHSSLNTEGSRRISVITSGFIVPEPNRALFVGGPTGSTATVDGNEFLLSGSQCVGAVMIRGQTTATMRNNGFGGLTCSEAAVSQLSGEQLDMGTSTSPGGNVFEGGNTDLFVDSTARATALGNTWTTSSACGRIVSDGSVIVEGGLCPGLD